jgi:hypothetical protein
VRTRYGDEHIDALTDLMKERAVTADRCPTCGHEDPEAAEHEP